MRVKVLESTDNAEKLMCASARGDYMSDWNGEKSFEEIMSTVKHDKSNLERAKENNYYPNETDATEAKIISFIEKQLSRGHYGPAEHASITFSVKGVSRVLMAQITRHRHMSFDVQSMRYVDFSNTGAVDPQSLLDPEHFSRETGITELNEEERKRYLQEYRNRVSEAMESYEDMVDSGVPKEDARFVLPLGTPVNMTFSGNARTMMHVLNLRQKANSQWEIRQLSEKIANHLEEWMPYTGEWWNNNGPMKISP